MERLTRRGKRQGFFLQSNEQWMMYFFVSLWQVNFLRAATGLDPEQHRPGEHQLWQQVQQEEIRQGIHHPHLDILK